MKIELNIYERNIILDCLNDTEELLKIKGIVECKKYHSNIEKLKEKFIYSLDKKILNKECSSCGGYINSVSGMSCKCTHNEETYTNLGDKE